jgi:hypothetical protein
VEITVREVTSNDPFMPTNEAMAEVAKLTFDELALSTVIDIIVNRMNDSESYHHVLKATKLLSYLLENGSNMVVKTCSDFYYYNIKRAFDLKFGQFVLPCGIHRKDKLKKIKQDLSLYQQKILKSLSDEKNSCPNSSVMEPTTLDRNAHFDTVLQQQKLNVKDKNESVHVFDADNSKPTSYMPEYSCKNIRRMFFNLLKNSSNVKLLVRDLVSSDLCMPTDEAMAVVARLTFDYLVIFQIMNTIKHKINRLCIKYNHFKYLPNEIKFVARYLKTTKLIWYLLENGSRDFTILCYEIPDIWKLLNIRFIIDKFEFFWEKMGIDSKFVGTVSYDIQEELVFWKTNILKKLLEHPSYSYGRI